MPVKTRDFMLERWRLVIEGRQQYGYPFRVALRDGSEERIIHGFTDAEAFVLDAPNADWELKGRAK